MPRRREPDFVLPTREPEIAGTCGPQISEAGRQLWQSGAVKDRERDEEEIYADVVVGGRAYEASFDQMVGPECECRDFERTCEPCQHIAALLWAWIKEPDTFSEDWYNDEEDADEDDVDPDLPGLETLQFMTSPQAALFTVSGDLIHNKAGKATAKYGRELWRNGTISERSFDGETLKAVVHDGAIPYLVRLNSSLMDNSCMCGRMTASTVNLCAHGAAVLYAWQAEMETFLPQEPANIKALFDKNPAFVRMLKELGGAQFEQLMSQVQAADTTQLTRSSPAVSATASSSESEDLIKGLLSSYRVEDLRLMAKRHDWKFSGTLKDGLVQQLHDYLREWGASGDVTEGLSPDETWLLQYTATALGTEATPTRGFFEAAWKHGKRDARKLDPAINGLIGAGLLFPCGQGAQAHYHILPYLASPPLMDLALKPLDARAMGRLTFPSNSPVLETFARLMQATRFASAGLKLAPAPPSHPQGAHYAWLRGWKYDAAEVEKLTQSKQVFYPRPDVGIPVWLSLNILAEESLALAQSWTGAPVEVVTWLFDVGSLAGLLASDAQKTDLAVRVNTEAWAVFQAEDPAQQIERLWTAWQSFATDIYLELAWAAQRHGNLAVMRSIAVPSSDWSPGKLASELIETRRFLSRMLASIAARAPDEWVAWDDLCAAIFGLRPNTLNFNYTRQVWWLAMEKGSRKRYDPHNRGDWEKSVRYVLAAMIEGPLQWLGLVELGFERDAALYPTLCALRVTPLGRWLLTGQGEPPAVALATQTTEPPAWLDAETWRLPPGAGSTELTAICRALGQPSGKPFTYRLTNESIERALLAGFAPPAIAAEFEGANIPLPVATRARIEQAAERIGRVRVYEELTLIELADDYALKELLAGTSLKKFLVCQLSPRLAVIKSEAADALVKEWVAKGYTPRVL